MCLNIKARQMLSQYTLQASSAGQVVLCCKLNELKLCMTWCHEAVGAVPGRPEMGWQLGIVINDSVVEVSGEPVIVRLQELIIASVPDQIGRPQTVHMPLSCHITYHQAVASGGPVAIHQLDVICPAAVYIWPCVLRREAAHCVLSGGQIF